MSVGFWSRWFAAGGWKLIWVTVPRDGAFGDSALTGGEGLVLF